jgi:hypothetical protein
MSRTGVRLEPRPVSGHHLVGIIAELTNTPAV